MAQQLLLSQKHLSVPLNCRCPSPNLILDGVILLPGMLQGTPEMDNGTTEIPTKLA